uniref:Uncharacterized protein n=1 Tax=Zea mays TaxID=4577 RepID=A0A804PTL3_MAIZE
MGNALGCAGLGERLAASARNGDAAEVRRLLEENPGLARCAAVGSSLNSPLHLAAAKGHHEIAALLLENGAEVNARNLSGETALMQACRFGHWEVVQTLLVFGCNVSVQGGQPERPDGAAPGGSGRPRHVRAPAAGRRRRRQEQAREQGGQRRRDGAAPGGAARARGLRAPAGGRARRRRRADAALHGGPHGGHRRRERAAALRRRGRRGQVLPDPRGARGRQGRRQLQRAGGSRWTWPGRGAASGWSTSCPPSLTCASPGSRPPPTSRRRSPARSPSQGTAACFSTRRSWTAAAPTPARSAWKDPVTSQPKCAGTSCAPSARWTCALWSSPTTCPGSPAPSPARCAGAPSPRSGCGPRRTSPSLT